MHFLETLTPKEITSLYFDWEVWARPKQLAPPGDWFIWLALAGRGFGKTRLGAEQVRAWAKSGRYPRIALVAPTYSDARDTMIEGESGIMEISPPDFYPHYEPSKRRLTWPNGARATIFSGEEPERLRGPQHFKAWGDELRAWKYMQDAWDNLMLGLRLGDNPQCVVTTTPRPAPVIKDLVKRRNDDVAVVLGTTYENLANLAPAFRRTVMRRYEGTRLGEQELNAVLLEDTPGALWTRAMIELSRVQDLPDLARIVVAIDPAVTSGEESDETGIIIAGLGFDGHAYVFEDITCSLSPALWAERAITGYYYYRADRIVAEVNNGGDMVETVLRAVDPTVSYKAVHASRGKAVRAEPIAAFYERGMVHHVGMFGELEDQQCSFVPGAIEGSPDRVDALVWALTDLMLPNEADQLDEAKAW